MVAEEVKWHYLNFFFGLLVVLVIASIKPIYKKTTEFTANCKESIVQSDTFFKASKGCFYIKGK